MRAKSTVAVDKGSAKSILGVCRNVLSGLRLGRARVSQFVFHGKERVVVTFSLS